MNDKLTRRDFIKQTARVGLGTAGVAGFWASLQVEGKDGAVPSETNRPTEEVQEPALEKRNYRAGMEYRRLGRTNLLVSVLGYGGHLRARQPNREERAEQIRTAFEAGVNFFETTDWWAQEVDVLAHALQDNQIKREECFITGLWWNRMDNVDDNTPLSKVKESIRQRAENILNILKTDYLDIYRMMWGDNLAISPNPETVQACIDVSKQLQKEGKIRFLGVTGHTHDVMVKAINEIDAWDTIHIPFSFAQNAAAKELIPLCKQKNVGVIVMKPFAAGSVFSAKQIHPSLKELVEQEKLSIAQAALKYVWSADGVCTAIPEMTHINEVKDNLGAVGKKIGMREKEVLKLFAEATNAALPPHYEWLKTWSACETIS